MSLVKLPGLIDVHVHLREPGATQKEDFLSGTRAAVKGGFTFVLDMPNNSVPTLTPERLAEKIALADSKAMCDVGFHYGTDGKNVASFAAAIGTSRVFGLKIYCNHTTGDLLIEDRAALEEIFKVWESPKPILVHAEGAQLETALELAGKYNRRVHDCHISLASEVELVRSAKRQGLMVSAGVTPHHLFLTKDDEAKLGVRAMMKPPLAAKSDQDALWRGITDGTIDMIETDHAPHLLSEKEAGTAKFGVPGLETALGLMARAVREGRIEREDIPRLMHENPKRIFKIPDQPDTYIEVDFGKSFVVRDEELETRCTWSPFAGWELPGVVETVVLRGKTLVREGKVV